MHLTSCVAQIWASVPCCCLLLTFVLPPCQLKADSCDLQAAKGLLRKQSYQQIAVCTGSQLSAAGCLFFVR